MCDSSSVNEMFRVFLSKFKLIFEHCFTYVTIVINHANKKKWITKGIKISCEKMKTLLVKETKIVGIL